jgi:hypothetical protein
MALHLKHHEEAVRKEIKVEQTNKMVVQHLGKRKIQAKLKPAGRLSTSLLFQKCGFALRLIGGRGGQGWFVSFMELVFRQSWT